METDSGFEKSWKRGHLSNSSSQRFAAIAGSILIGLIALVLFASAVAKFAKAPFVVSPLAADGFAGQRLLAIAVMEFLSALLFLVPRTRSLGLLLISSYMGGAIATHLGHDQSIVQPAVVLALAWVGVWLRHREVVWSFS